MNIPLKYTSCVRKDRSNAIVRQLSTKKFFSSTIKTKPLTLYIIGVRIMTFILPKRQ